MDEKQKENEWNSLLTNHTKKNHSNISFHTEKYIFFERRKENRLWISKGQRIWRRNFYCNIDFFRSLFYCIFHTHTHIHSVFLCTWLHNLSSTWVQLVAKKNFYFSFSVRNVNCILFKWEISWVKTFVR